MLYTIWEIIIQVATSLIKILCCLLLIRPDSFEVLETSRFRPWQSGHRSSPQKAPLVVTSWGGRTWMACQLQGKMVHYSAFLIASASSHHIPRIINIVFIVHKMFTQNHLCSCFFSPYLCNEFVASSPSFLFDAVRSAPECLFSCPMELFILYCLSFWWLQTAKYFLWKQGRSLHFPGYSFPVQLG